MKPISRILVMTLLCACLMMPAALAEQATPMPTGGEVTFSVQPILPNNQISGASSFYLRMSPEQEQMLQVQVTNMDDEDITVRLSCYPAFTNAYGVAQYSVSDEVMENAPIRLEDLVTIENDVLKVPAKSSAMAEFQVKMPEQSFDGILMGGFVLEKDQKADTSGRKVSGMGVQHKYAYAITVRLRETDVRVPPSFALEKAEVQEWMGIPVLQCTIANPNPMLAKPVTVQGIVTHDATQEVKIEDAMENVTLTPYALMPYRISLQEENALPPGEYTIDLTLRYDDQEWHFTEQFPVPGVATD